MAEMRFLAENIVSDDDEHINELIAHYRNNEAWGRRTFPEILSYICRGDMWICTWGSEISPEICHVSARY